MLWVGDRVAFIGDKVYPLVPLRDKAQAGEKTGHYEQFMLWPSCRLHATGYGVNQAGPRSFSLTVEKPWKVG